MTQAAIYLRQSLDADGDGARVEMQRNNCLDLAKREGLDVAPDRIYVDNNVSATSSKPRPAYQRMVKAVQAGEIDVVIAWNLDRLSRRPREIEDWLDWNEKHGVNLLTSERRERIDLSTDNGRMMLRITAAVARGEVERKGRRQKEANAGRRKDGLPAGGRRAFGYTRLVAGAENVTAKRLDADGREWLAYGHEPLEPEATAVRRGYDMLLAGATLRSIARSWNESGLTTTVGHAWEPYAVRGVFANPRYAALIAPPRAAVVKSADHHLGLDALASGTWEPLVSPETWLAARDLLSDPVRRSNRGNAPRWLLSGLATCGVCGATMKGGATGGVQVYRCNASAHLARKRDDAEHYITEVVIERLSRPDAFELLADRDAPDVDRLRGELREAQQGEANVLSMVARGLTSMTTAEATLRDVRKRIGELEAAMTDAGKVDVLGPLVAAGDAREAWLALDIDRQRAVVRALMRVEMRSPGKGSRPPRDGAGRLAHTRATMPIVWH